MAGDLDISEYLEPGDTVLAGQAVLALESVQDMRTIMCSLRPRVGH